MTAINATITTGCTRNCTCCSTPCSIVIISATTGTGQWPEPWEPFPSFPTYTPDPVDEYIYPEPVGEETIRFWRRESRKKSRYSNILEHKPLIKRRTPYSISRLDRRGHLRKKGKR
jgi:hypothetical protein